MAKVSSQVNALFRKNAIYQRRNWLANSCLIIAPVLICVLLFVIQTVVNQLLDTPENRCGCKCLVCTETVETCVVDAQGVPQCTSQEERREGQGCMPGTYDKCKTYDKTQCGLEFSDGNQAGFCGVPHPSVLPTFQVIPAVEDRATVPPGVKGSPDAPAPFMFASEGAGVGAALYEIMYPPAAPPLSISTEAGQTFNLGQVVTDAGLSLATPSDPELYRTYIIDPALLGEDTFALSSDCSAFTDPVSIGVSFVRTNLSCAPLVASPQPDSAAINDALYCGWKDARCQGVKETNGYLSPIDFKDTSLSKLAFSFWSNFTTGTNNNQPSAITRPNQLMALAFGAFLKWTTGGADGELPRRTSSLVGIAEFPTVAHPLRLDFSSLIGQLFYTWILMLLLPVMIVQLVYEKQYKLQSMMKMHGLSNFTYWVVMYAWYFMLHVGFIFLLVVVGSAVGLNFFRLNDYSVQIVFYLLFINMQIALACLVSTLYSNTRTAVVSTCLYVFGSGLVANLLIDQFYARAKWYKTICYLFPAFGLYRGMWEFGEYAFRAAYLNSTAMTWSSFKDSDNDMWQVMLIFALQGPLFLLMAWYLNVVLPGNGIHKHWLFCLRSRKREKTYSNKLKDVQLAQAPRGDMPFQSTPGALGTSAPGGLASMPGQPVASGDKNRSVSVRVQASIAADVVAEHEAALAANPRDAPIVLRNIGKVYPPRDGQPAKVALDDLSLVVRKGECFGMLGPNGAGKTTCISIMVGMLEASSGEAFIAGLDLADASTQMWKCMGVCPQDNILWDSLTAHEHLLFYGRLKGLQGANLTRAVDDALAAVQLTSAGKKRSKTYSGGMKRRLSVAISLIGNPDVCYLDEPSTGLDPASRQALWSAVKAAKQDRAIILTTHSMQEAEMLCDRLGIVVGGKLVCIGKPRDLTSRYGQYLELSITVPPAQVERAAAFVSELATGAIQTYALAGALRFDLPTGEVSIYEVFSAMHAAKAARGLDVIDWGLANATLEEVFIKVARQAGATATD